MVPAVKLFFIAVYTLILGPIAIIFSFLDPTHTIPVGCSKIWAWLILKTSGVKLVVEGKENITRGPVIYMTNHASHFDVAALLYLLPWNVRFVAKKELASVPVFGWAMVLMGHVIIDRSNREKAIISLDKAAEKIRKGTSVAYFPEGTRSPDGKIQPFKKGGFMLALKAGVPIVPVSIYNSFNILPKTTWKIRAGTIYIKFHPQVDTSAYNEEERDALIEKVHSIIRQGIEELENSYGQSVAA